MTQYTFFRACRNIAIVAWLITLTIAHLTGHNEFLMGAQNTIMTLILIKSLNDFSKDPRKAKDNVDG